MDWFKMQTIWWAPLKRLSEAEAGRFLKAIYEFVVEGREYEGSGREELLVVQAIETLREDVEHFAHVADKTKAEANEAKRSRSEAGKKAANARWAKQKGETDDGNLSKTLQSDANGCESMRNDAIYANACESHKIASNRINRIDSHKIACREEEKERDLYISSCSSNNAHAREGQSDQSDRPDQTDQVDPERTSSEHSEPSECLNDPDHSDHQSNSGHQDSSRSVWQSSGLGDTFTDEELDQIQKHRLQDIPAIEQQMRACGGKFSPADETIFLELLNEYSVDEIMQAIAIANGNGKVFPNYIKGVLKKQKEQKEGMPFDRNGTYGQSVYGRNAGGNRQGVGPGANDPSRADVPDWLKEQFNSTLV